MGKTIGFLKIDNSYLINRDQKLKILDCAREKNLLVDQFRKFKASGNFLSTQENLKLELNKLKGDETIIFSEISKLELPLKDIKSLIKSLLQLKVFFKKHTSYFSPAAP